MFANKILPPEDVNVYAFMKARGQPKTTFAEFKLPSNFTTKEYEYLRIDKTFRKRNFEKSERILQPPQETCHRRVESLIQLTMQKIQSLSTVNNLTTTN